VDVTESPLVLDWLGFIARLREGLINLLETGGPVAVVLLLFSVLALTIVLLKLWQFTVLGIGRRRFIDTALEYWRDGDPGQALGVLDRVRNPVAQVMEVAIRGRWRSPDHESRVREEVERVASAWLESLRRYLRGLELVATLSPLLGLLGTVLGMIEAFRRLEEAGQQVDPAILSGGIWEALLTTALGLAVAIPAVIVLNWLERIIERLAHRMEDAVTQVFTSDLKRLAAPAPVTEGLSLRSDHAT